MKCFDFHREVRHVSGVNENWFKLSVREDHQAIAIQQRRLLPLAPAPPMVVAGPAWDRLTAGQMFPLCSYGEQMENRSANVAGGVRRSVSRPGGVRPLPRREAVAGWFCLPRLRRLQGLGA